MLKNFWGWVKGWRLDKVFLYIKTDGAKFAIGITEGVKTALNSGVLNFVADIVSKTFPQLHDLPQTLVADLNKAIPTILAAELAVQGLPDNPTEADILAFENNILKAFSVTDQKSKLYTILAAQVYGIIKAEVDKGVTITFAQMVIDIEKAYQLYLADVAAQNATA